MAITLPEFENLLDEMRTADKLKTIRNQLTCASELVFHGGVTLGELPQLTVGDVLDKKDEIVQHIDKFEKTITINGEKVKKPLKINEKMKVSLQNYLKTPKQRDVNLKRRNPLFPAYQNADRLKTHWKNFGTDYRELINSGIRSFYGACREGEMPEEEAQRATANQFRQTRRSIEANVTGKRIPAGKKKNDPHRRLLELSEYADLIEDGDPGGKQQAEAIMSELEKVYEAAPGKLKKQIERLRESFFKPRLSRFFVKQTIASPDAAIDSSPEDPSST